MDENDQGLMIEDDVDPDFLQQFAHLLNVNAPQLMEILNQHGFIRENDVNDAVAAIVDSDNSENSDEDSSYLPSEADDNSIEDVYVNSQTRDLILHSPMNIDDHHHHLGPRDEPVIDGDCDCNFFNGNSNQCLLSNRGLNWLDINFDEEYDAARVFYESNQHREPNNLQRKRLYRKIWVNLGNNVQLEFNEETGRYDRTKLPNCSYALVRMIWPSQTGQYMGFRLH